MPWADEWRTLKLPLRPVRELDLQFAVSWGREGARVTVHKINAAGRSLDIVPGDICMRINGTRPRSDAHALSLFDRLAAKSDGYHTCIMLRPGFGRVGRVLIQLFGLMAVTALMFACEIGYVRVPWRSQ